MKKAIKAVGMVVIVIVVAIITIFWTMDEDIANMV